MCLPCQLSSLPHNRSAVSIYSCIRHFPATVNQKLNICLEALVRQEPKSQTLHSVAHHLCMLNGCRTFAATKCSYVVSWMIGVILDTLSGLLRRRVVADLAISYAI
jgi:hypothetical protein